MKDIPIEKKKKSFPFQSVLGVQKNIVIKKIVPSGNSLQIYNKKRNKQNNEITNFSFRQFQS